VRRRGHSNASSLQREARGDSETLEAGHLLELHKHVRVRPNVAEHSNTSIRKYTESNTNCTR